MTECPARTLGAIAVAAFLAASGRLPAQTAIRVTEVPKGAARLKPVADLALARVNDLNRDVGRLKFEGPGTEGYWKTRLEELIGQVKARNYAEVSSVGNIRNLGNQQDEMVSRCRQYVKGIRQDMILQDTADPEVRKFVAAVRERCQQILRNRHDKECM